MSDDSDNVNDCIIPNFELNDGHGCCFDVIIPIKCGGSRSRGWDKNKLISYKLAQAVKNVIAFAL